MYVKMSKIKENEMDLMAQRNDRLNRIHRDVNQMQQLNEHQITAFEALPNFEDFKDENLSKMLTIMSCTIESQLSEDSNQNSSKSQQFIRNQSFYKRALDDMMDGVLKVCWEDELKKDPPKPLCLQQKNFNSDFSDIERAQIDKYYEKLAKHRLDREKYIEQLLEEKKTLEYSVDNQIKKLNQCIESIIKTKVKAQFAISSEQLKILMCVRDYLKLKRLSEIERKLV